MTLTRLLDDGLDRVRLDRDKLIDFRKRLVALLDEWVEAERTAAGCPSTWSPTLVGIMEDDAAALKKKILDILS